MPDPITPRIRTTTLNKYVRKKVETIYPKLPLLGVLRGFGRLSFNNSGRKIVWYPRYRRRELETGLGEAVSATFVATNTRLEAESSWRHYHMTERISRFEKLVNKGKEALIRIVQTTVNELLEDMEVAFKMKLYINSGSNPEDIDGLQTVHDTSATAIGSAGDTPAKNPSSNKSYAGIAMQLGALGGSWTGHFPIGYGDSEYAAWTSLIVDGTDSNFFANGTWAGDWQSVLRFTRTYLGMRTGIDPNICVMNAELLRQAMDSLKDAQRLEVSKTPQLLDLGIRALAFEGLDLVADYACPNGLAFMLNAQHIELMCLSPQLFYRSEDDDITTSTQLIRLDFDGQMVYYSPACVGIIDTVTNFS